MDLNFNIADLYIALQEFAQIVKQLHRKAWQARPPRLSDQSRDGGQDEVERKRLKAVLALAKADIEELFDQVGGE